MALNWGTGLDRRMCMALQLSCSALAQSSVSDSHTHTHTHTTLLPHPYPQRVSSSHGKSSSESRSFLPLLPDPTPHWVVVCRLPWRGVQRHAMPRPTLACPAHVVLCVRNR
ncbi:hypothetical protein BDP55DRAFT_714125 [Colletotrichum godetiae]|uniref:Uncharacterized protein n=1 Tax=Colletotrichum godetiae TaxID=1209918 RepID=A0AAJ0AQI2_9PEZI|nr:uncharacterized protein BDP55DRAFT_714125 [Colletotrichum godetiae]KAK1687827.1 hypothetical protein BDP55DRAFT_714125 [Colletotrichum godetiae]